jgi:hypothetical protein
MDDDEKQIEKEHDLKEDTKNTRRFKSFRKLSRAFLCGIHVCPFETVSELCIKSSDSIKIARNPKIQ